MKVSPRERPEGKGEIGTPFSSPRFLRGRCRRGASGASPGDGVRYEGEGNDGASGGEGRADGGVQAAVGEVTLSFSAERVTRFLFLVLLALTMIHLLTWYLHFYTRLDMFTVFRVFDFDEEMNIPTLFNTALLVLIFITAVFAGVDSFSRNLPRASYWFVLGLVAAFFAVDEFTSLHETLVEPMRGLFGIEAGFLYLAWVIPAVFILAVLSLLLARFVFSLPPDVRRLLLFGFFLFALGAVGMEMVQGYLTTHYAAAGVARRLVTVAEEFLEMAGLIVFLKGLLRRAATDMPPLRLEVTP